MFISRIKKENKKYVSSNSAYYEVITMIYDIFGNEFIFIENKFHPEDGFSFNLKILDAINSIRNGYGDCIVRSNIRSDLTRSYSPIDLYDYYLNPFINNIYVILYKDRTV